MKLHAVGASSLERGPNGWIDRSAGDAKSVRLRRLIFASSKGLLDPPCPSLNKARLRRAYESAFCPNDKGQNYRCAC
jgi:hypothetical protein